MNKNLLLSLILSGPVQGPYHGPNPGWGLPTNIPLEPEDDNDTNTEDDVAPELERRGGTQ